MMNSYGEQALSLDELVAIQVQGNLAQVLDQEEVKINVFFYQAETVEIHCRLMNAQWTPFLAIFRSPTSLQKAVIHQPSVVEKQYIEK